MKGKIEQNLVYEYVMEIIKMHDLRSKIHDFPSGAIMLDVWKLPDILVVQLYEETIGFSIINEENPGFSTVPDFVFADFDSFKEEFDRVLRL